MVVRNRNLSRKADPRIIRKNPSLFVAHGTSNLNTYLQDKDQEQKNGERVLCLYKELSDDYPSIIARLETVEEMFGALDIKNKDIEIINKMNPLFNLFLTTFDPLFERERGSSLLNRLQFDEDINNALYPLLNLAPIEEKDVNFGENTEERLMTLQKKHPKVKIDAKLGKDIQLAIYFALERAPEVRGEVINFVTVDGFKLMPSKQHVMRSTGDYSIMLREMLGFARGVTREYRVEVNTLERNGVATLENVSDMAKFAVLVHEFMHTISYKMISSWKISKMIAGLAISPSWIRQMERRTDEAAISRGAGYGLYKYRMEVASMSNAQYQNFKKKTYLRPEEILHTILKHADAYSDDTLKKVLMHIENKEH